MHLDPIAGLQTQSGIGGRLPGHTDLTTLEKLFCLGPGEAELGAQIRSDGLTRLVLFNDEKMEPHVQRSTETSTKCDSIHISSDCQQQ